MYESEGSAADSDSGGVEFDADGAESDAGRARIEGAEGTRHGATRSFSLGAPDLGRRLDHLVVERIPTWSRSRLQALIRDGRVKVAGVVVQKPNHLLEAPATLTVDLPPARAAALDVVGAPIESLVVLHEDEDLVVIDKPAGLTSHPKLAAPDAEGHAAPFGGLSVSDLAVARFGALPVGQGMGRPGIVHRLDRLTSGVMVLARSEAALIDLMRQFRQRVVEKTYLALVHGEPRFDSQWIDVPLAANPRSPDRQRVATREQLDSGEAREAETYIEVETRFKSFTLLACKPKTGRTHQIRVHLQHVGLPIVGDRIYHPRGALSVPLPEAAPPLERQALHAHRLAFDHPRTGERLTFEAEVPSDLATLLRWLGSHRAN